MKKALALMLICALAATLVSCGLPEGPLPTKQDPAQSSQSTQSAQSTQSSQPSQTPPTAPQLIAPPVASVSLSAPVAADEFVAVSAGGMQSLLVTADGSLWAWGSIDYRYGLTVGGEGSVLSYAPVKIMDDVAGASAGANHSMVIKRDGSLWAWGRNEYGCLGDGTTTPRIEPVHIMDDVSYVSAGSFRTMAIKKDGSLWAWGENEYGQLGDGTKTNRASPVKIMDGVAAVSAKGGNTAAVKTDGSLWAWGWNRYGQIGDGTYNVFETIYTNGFPSALVEVENNDRSSPVKVMDGVAMVSVSGIHSMAVKKDGTLWAWGGYTYEGASDSKKTSVMPTPFMVMDGVAYVSASWEYNAVIKTDGSLWTWGYNGRGQLGNGTNSDKKEPFKIMDGVAVISTSSSHSLAIKKNGTLWGWGDNRGGKIGGLAPDECRSPVEIFVYEVIVILDGRRLSFEVAPFLVNGRVLVPLRAIFEELGASIDWDNAKKTVKATKGDAVVELALGSTSPTVNGSVVPIDQPGVVVGGRILVPLRFVAEAFGVTVDWDPASQTATIANR